MTNPSPHDQLWRWSIQQLLDFIQSTATTLTATVTALQATVAALQTQVNNLFTNVTGIKFAATQVPSSDVNTLDDYEEGTWTPVVTVQTGALTSYTANGTYTKIGRLVFINCNILISNNGTGAGVMFVAGLPFTAAADSTGGGREIAVVGYWMEASLGSGSSTLSILRYDNTYAGGTNYQLRLAVTYITT